MYLMSITNYENPSDEIPGGLILVAAEKLYSVQCLSEG